MFDTVLFFSLLKFFGAIILIGVWLFIGLICAYFALSDDRISTLARWLGLIIGILWFCATISFLSAALKNEKSIPLKQSKVVQTETKRH